MVLKAHITIQQSPNISCSRKRDSGGAVRFTSCNRQRRQRRCGAFGPSEVMLGVQDCSVRMRWGWVQAHLQVMRKMDGVKRDLQLVSLQHCPPPVKGLSRHYLLLGTHSRHYVFQNTLVWLVIHQELIKKLCLKRYLGCLACCRRVAQQEPDSQLDGWSHQRKRGYCAKQKSPNPQMLSQLSVLKFWNSN